MGRKWRAHSPGADQKQNTARQNAYRFLHLFQRSGRVQSKPALDLVTMID
jgi:hypothetical protein